MKTTVFLATLLITASSAFAQYVTETESPRLVINRTSHHRHRADGTAHLIIHRTPNLGNDVAVCVWIDGVAVGPIGYGHKYETEVSSGPHVLSFLPTPSPTWHTAVNIPVNIRSGETYNFTVQGDHSGYLTLSGGPIAY